MLIINHVFCINFRFAKSLVFVFLVFKNYSFLIPTGKFLKVFDKINNLATNIDGKNNPI